MGIAHAALLHTSLRMPHQAIFALLEIATTRFPLLYRFVFGLVTVNRSASQCTSDHLSKATSDEHLRPPKRANARMVRHCQFGHASNTRFTMLWATKTHRSSLFTAKICTPSNGFRGPDLCGPDARVLVLREPVRRGPKRCVAVRRDLQYQRNSFRRADRAGAWF